MRRDSETTATLASKAVAGRRGGAPRTSRAAGREAEIFAERDRKLEAARGRRRQARQLAAAGAYCWLFHLVGDSHQPLDSCALFSANRFPQGDRGGNLIPLVRGDNLHALWDNLLGRQHYIRNVDREVAELSDGYRDVWDSAARERNPRKWIAESFELAQDFAYDEAVLEVVRRATPQQPLEKIELSDEYLKEAGHQARRRIVAAGVRLVAALEPGL